MILVKQPEHDQAKRRLKLLQLERFERIARMKFIDFCRYCWMGPGRFVTGPHLEGLANEVDLCIAAYLRGESTNLLVAMPFRHGKSSMVSRLFPAFFLAKCAASEPSVVLSGYGASLVLDASQDCRRIISGARYHRLFPEATVDPTANRVDNWRMSGSAGRIVAAGLGGALAGRGYHLGILDDYCKNREEAESQLYRNSTWQSFSNDFLTRRMSPSITVVMATPWHVDDIRGRILQAMDKSPEFPRFKNVSFPARNKDGSFLWESFLGAQWYREHYSTLSPYEAAGLLDCDPDIKSGGMFSTDSFKKAPASTVDHSKVVGACRYWDKAASDGRGCFTAGVLMLRMVDKQYVVYDVARGQWDTSVREQRIRACAEADRLLFPNVRIGIEQEPGSGGVDSAKFTVQNLNGFTVIVDKVTGSKETRAGPWSSVVNSGQVTLVESLWNQALIDEHASFPAGRTKDIVDAASGAFSKLFSSGMSGSGGVFPDRTVM